MLTQIKNDKQLLIWLKKIKINNKHFSTVTTRNLEESVDDQYKVPETKEFYEESLKNVEDLYNKAFDFYKYLYTEYKNSVKFYTYNISKPTTPKKQLLSLKEIDNTIKNKNEHIYLDLTKSNLVMLKVCWSRLHWYDRASLGYIEENILEFAKDRKVTTFMNSKYEIQMLFNNRNDFKFPMHNTNRRMKCLVEHIDYLVSDVQGPDIIGNNVVYNFSSYIELPYIFTPLSNKIDSTKDNDEDIYYKIFKKTSYFLNFVNGGKRYLYYIKLLNMFPWLSDEDMLDINFLLGWKLSSAMKKLKYIPSFIDRPSAYRYSRVDMESYVLITRPTFYDSTDKEISLKKVSPKVSNEILSKVSKNNKIVLHFLYDFRMKQIYYCGIKTGIWHRVKPEYIARYLPGGLVSSKKQLRTFLKNVKARNSLDLTKLREKMLHKFHSKHTRNIIILLFKHGGYFIKKFVVLNEKSSSDFVFSYRKASPNEIRRLYLTSSLSDFNAFPCHKPIEFEISNLVKTTEKYMLDQVDFVNIYKFFENLLPKIIRYIKKYYSLLDDYNIVILLFVILLKMKYGDMSFNENKDIDNLNDIIKILFKGVDLELECCIYDIQHHGLNFVELFYIVVHEKSFMFKVKTYIFSYDIQLKCFDLSKYILKLDKPVDFKKKESNLKKIEINSKTNNVLEGPKQSNIQNKLNINKKTSENILKESKALARPGRPKLTEIQKQLNKKKRYEAIQAGQILPTLGRPKLTKVQKLLNKKKRYDAMQAGQILPKLGRPKLTNIQKLLNKKKRYDAMQAGQILPKLGRPKLTNVQKQLNKKKRDDAIQAGQTLPKLGRPKLTEIQKLLNKKKRYDAMQAGQILPRLGRPKLLKEQKISNQK